MAGFVGGIFLFKVVEDIAYAQTIAGNLIGIGGTDAFAGGTYLVLAFLGLIGGIEQTMGGHDEMGLLGDMQALLQFMAAGLERLGFLHEQVGSQYDTITDDIYLTTLEDARGNGAKHILLALELQRMTGIGTALKTSHHIILRGEHINYLTFSFVAPLQTQQDIYFSLIHCCFIYFGSFFSVLHDSYASSWPDSYCRCHRYRA